MMTNKENKKADNVRMMVKAAGYDEPYEVRDMLTDIMHYCEEEDISFYDELHIAKENFTYDFIKTILPEEKDV